MRERERSCTSSSPSRRDGCMTRLQTTSRLPLCPRMTLLEHFAFLHIIPQHCYLVLSPNPEAALILERALTIESP